MDSAQFHVHANIEEKHWWFLARRTIMKSLLPPGRLLVDVGCGTGGNTAFFRNDYRCIGIDPIPEAIDFARSRFPDIDFRVGYAPEDIPEIKEADVVLLMDVLEHVESDCDLVARILSAMKPEAHILLMAPADKSLWGQHDVGFDHYRRYDLGRFRQTWEGCPVTEIIVSYCNSRLYPLIKSARILSRVLKKSLGPASTDLGMPPRCINALLYTIFAGEAKVLQKTMKGGNGFRHGVSVIAVLRRDGDREARKETA